MALAIDASTPAAKHSANDTTAALTSNSFSPPAGSVIFLFWAADSNSAFTPTTPTITDSLGSHLTWNLVQWSTKADTGAGNAEAAIWYANCPSAQAGMTVTVTNNLGGSVNSLDAHIAPVVFTGADTTQNGATGKGGSASNTGTATYTSTRAGSQGFIVFGDWNASSSHPTLQAGCTEQNWTTLATSSTGWTIRETSTIGSSGTSVTIGASAPTVEGRFAYVEVLPSVAAASIPSAPQRLVQLRDPSETYWTQRDRRNANLVATVANPLVAPLDSAWQAGGRYWHLYGDASDAASRSWQSLQRSYASSPDLLGPAPTDPLTLAAGDGGDLWRRYNAPAYVDRREVPQQRPYTSSPALLATALLENELLGSADDLRRRYFEPAYCDRREMPQQRSYVSDPSLLATAELENELLGGAETPKRAAVPATHAPRWWMPRQPKRDATAPGLLDTAELENELLGGADTARHYLAAAFYDRREVPQQRAHVSDPLLLVPPVPLDPTLAGWLPAWQEYTQAAIHVDRREVPQQRLYISDPSFYPTTAPTDPLTLAWGAGGTYRMLYATAALQVGRREVPQQRAYVSGPALLTTAELENELLGGTDDLRRRSLAAAYYDRREVPAQRVFFDPALLVTALLEGALLGGADTWRHGQVFTDRRQTVAPRPVFAPSGSATPTTDPLTLAAGVGGDLWRRYNAPAYVDRREAPQQRPPRRTLAGEVVNATSSAAVSAFGASAPNATATYTSSSGVVGTASSSPGAIPTYTSAPGVAGTASSNPSVSDG